MDEMDEMDNTDAHGRALTWPWAAIALGVALVIMGLLTGCLERKPVRVYERGVDVYVGQSR